MNILRVTMIIFSSLTAASLFGFQIVEIAHSIMDTVLQKK